MLNQRVKKLRVKYLLSGEYLLQYTPFSSSIYIQALNNEYGDTIDVEQIFEDVFFQYPLVFMQFCSSLMALNCITHEITNLSMECDIQ